MEGETERSWSKGAKFQLRKISSVALSYNTEPLFHNTALHTSTFAKKVDLTLSALTGSKKKKRTKRVGGNIPR